MIFLTENLAVAARHRDQIAAVGGQRHADLFAQIGEITGDSGEQTIEALDRAKPKSRRSRSRAVARSWSFEQVGFVHHDHPRRGAGADLLEHAIDDLHMLGGERRTGVDDVQQQVGGADLFERRLEGLDQHMRQAMDKADRIGEHHLGLARQPQTPNRRIEGRERPVGGLDAGVGERIHQGGLAGVGIADQRDRRVGHFEAAAALYRAGALDVLEADAQAGQAFAQTAAVNFELSFAGSASADTTATGAAAAGLPRQMGPLAGQSRLQIAELGDFDLQLAFEGARALGEDIENKLAAIDNAQLQFIFEIASLRGTEGVVENRERCAFASGQLADFDSFAPADEGARVDCFEPLLDLACDLGAGAFGQRAEFGKRIFGGDAVDIAQLDADQNRAFGVIE